MTCLHVSGPGFFFSFFLSPFLSFFRRVYKRTIPCEGADKCDLLNSDPNAGTWWWWGCTIFGSEYGVFGSHESYGEAFPQKPRTNRSLMLIYNWENTEVLRLEPHDQFQQLTHSRCLHVFIPAMPKWWCGRGSNGIQQGSEGKISHLR